MSKKKFKLSNEKIPENLMVESLFVSLLSFDARELFFENIKRLKSFEYDAIEYLDHPTEGYIFAKGNIPVCLCAHMDKVLSYDKIKKILYYLCKDKQKNIVDVWLSSNEGIGGDDRCGVYAIYKMLEKGHRPYILFTMGEELGCCGARRFCADHDKDFLKDVNAFIQIDRRGNKDVVRYSDTNDKLTKAIEQFGFKFAYGSCTDISVLMPHFGISGVNLSSGYYNEHQRYREYISIKDVNYLIERLDKILHSNIFVDKYEYVKESFDYRTFFNSNKDRYYQMSLFDDIRPDYSGYDFCECCGEYVRRDDLVETGDPEYILVCKDCAENIYLKQGWIKCPSCGNLVRNTINKNEPQFVKNFCEFCGCLLDDND